MAFDAEAVDKIILRFETAAAKQAASKDDTVKFKAAVKLVSAERDLLCVVDDVRWMLHTMVKGDKNVLGVVFGSPSDRFDRMKEVMNRTALSNIHREDPRWQDLAASISKVQGILDGLGTFKSWLIGPKPISALRYAGVAARLTPGALVSCKPEYQGAAPNTFTVDPKLPEDLSLNKTTGEIKGKLKTGFEVAATTYVITAVNGVGMATADVTFCVMFPPPESVRYPLCGGQCFTWEHVDWAVEVKGGTAREFSVEPLLPTGLELDPYKGTINGTVADTTDAVEYIVTARSPCGSASCTLALTVKEAPPHQLSYIGLQKDFPENVEVTMRPELVLQKSDGKPGKQHSVLEGMRFAVVPALPKGLNLDTKAGVIAGTPTAYAPEEAYEVTVRNDQGAASVVLRFGIQMLPPTKLSYPEMLSTIQTGEVISVQPVFTGFVTVWEVAPSFPAGLVLNSETGTIGGKAEARAIACANTYTVMAKNKMGVTSCAVVFEVVIAAPKNLHYPMLKDNLGCLVPVSLEPVCDSLVDEYWIEPPLPVGLELATESGVISGTPTTLEEPKSFWVTATNARGSETVVIHFGTENVPPSNLRYPDLGAELAATLPVKLHPEVDGGATSWSVSPGLPANMSLDVDSGEITGSPLAVAGMQEYTITATNELGSVSSTFAFATVVPPPRGLRYPSMRPDYTCGIPLHIHAEMDVGVACEFAVEPALPDGIRINASTGSISGRAKAEVECVIYTVTATNVSGSTDVELMFECTDGMDTRDEVDPSFAASLDAIEHVADMCQEPSKKHAFGNWMVWMVHRAWLDDPMLTQLNFANCSMPPAEEEPRISPKLMKALKTNTHITTINVSNANLMEQQGYDLADALRINTTLRVLNMEGNALDEGHIREIALSLTENTKSSLQQWRFDGQKLVDEHLGSAVEEIISNMVETRPQITKVGFRCGDPQWAAKINHFVKRNADLARQG
uniref:Uncharacterized protein n=1 Tax=Noctiluca scintillans TaxID=2966 RepID=A0A7S1AV98_NOCSC|mmetsp:Transcript_61068/g.162146  ORF Transcript_61068/g.162146 Transcript_61068/m.162146 type:complete len:965 (+) Transcript_61068:107-3001(+)